MRLLATAATLCLLAFENLRRHPGLPYAAVVKYKPHATPEIVVLPVEAIRVQEVGFAALQLRAAIAGMRTGRTAPPR